MGLLDDAIREHLDLQRRRGGDPAEIERLEREALGPVRRGPAASQVAEPDDRAVFNASEHFEAPAAGAPAQPAAPAAPVSEPFGHEPVVDRPSSQPPTSREAVSRGASSHEALEHPTELHQSDDPFDLGGGGSQHKRRGLFGRRSKAPDGPTQPEPDFGEQLRGRGGVGPVEPVRRATPSKPSGPAGAPEPSGASGSGAPTEPAEPRLIEPTPRAESAPLPPDLAFDDDFHADDDFDEEFDREPSGHGDEPSAATESPDRPAVPQSFEPAADKPAPPPLSSPSPFDSPAPKRPRFAELPSQRPAEPEPVAEAPVEHELGSTDDFDPEATQIHDVIPRGGLPKPPARAAEPEFNHEPEPHEQLESHEEPEFDEPGFDEPGAAAQPSQPAPREADDWSEETQIFDVPGHFEQEDAAASADEGDVLDQTPEFLQDTPDHDRLWFEQKPPRDFDFDG